MNISSEGPKRVVEKGYDRMAEEYGRLEEGHSLAPNALA